MELLVTAVYFGVWLGLAFATSAIAASRNRSVRAWFFIGLIAPVAAMIGLYLSSPKPRSPAAFRSATIYREKCRNCSAPMGQGVAVCTACGAQRAANPTF